MPKDYRQDNSSNSKDHHDLRDILCRLMEECDIDEAQLSRETGIPASNIYRMRTHSNSNPTAASLRPLAKFFDVSIDQLLGDEELPLDRLPGTHNPLNFTSARMPILTDWSLIPGWIEKSLQSSNTHTFNWISTEKVVGENVFAIIIPTELFGISFKKGALIIADPDKAPEDGDFALLQIENDENILLRQILREGKDVYLKSVNPELKGTILLTEKHRFLGVIVETRFSFEGSQPLLKKTVHAEIAIGGRVAVNKTTR